MQPTTSWSGIWLGWGIGQRCTVGPSGAAVPGDRPPFRPCAAGAQLLQEQLQQAPFEPPGPANTGRAQKTKTSSVAVIIKLHMSQACTKKRKEKVISDTEDASLVWRVTGKRTDFTSAPHNTAPWFAAKSRHLLAHARCGCGQEASSGRVLLSTLYREPEMLVNSNGSVVSPRTAALLDILRANAARLLAHYARGS